MRPPILAVLCAATILVAAAPASADINPNVLHFDRDLDAPILAATGFAFIAGSLLQPTIIHRPTCSPCLVADVNPLDRPFAGLRDPLSDNLSYGFLFAAMLAPPIIDAIDVARSGGTFSTWANDLGVYAEALTINAALNTAVKLAVARPRPLAYDLSLPDELRNSSETYVSFYSLHTSFAFTAAAAAATTYALRHSKNRALTIAIALGGAALAGTTAALRVTAGRHYPTDVATGALIGTAIGIGVPLLHRVRQAGGPRIAVFPVEGGFMASVGWVR